MATYIQQFAQASATASGDLGEQFLAIRNDSGATQFASANLIYTPIGANASGWIWVTGNINATQNGTWNVNNVASVSGAIMVGAITASITPATGDDNLGTREAQTISGTKVGVLALFRNPDNGDYEAGLLTGDRFLRVAVEPSPDGNSVRTSSKSTSNLSETYTSAASGAMFGDTTAPSIHYSLQIIPTGAVSAWNVVLEISLNGSNFTPILTSTQADGTAVKSTTTPTLAPVWRTRCTSITLGAGTNIIAFASALSG